MLELNRWFVEIDAAVFLVAYALYAEEKRLGRLLRYCRYTGLVPSLQQQIISFSRSIHPRMTELPCRPV